jgi:hypothetical protein
VVVAVVVVVVTAMVVVVVVVAAVVMDWWGCMVVESMVVVVVVWADCMVVASLLCVPRLCTHLVAWIHLTSVHLIALEEHDRRSSLCRGRQRGTRARRAPVVDVRVCTAWK